MKRIVVIFAILCVASNEILAKLPQEFFALAKEVLDLQKREMELGIKTAARINETTDATEVKRILEEEWPKQRDLIPMNTALAKIVPYIALIKAEISEQKCLDIASTSSCPPQDRALVQQGEFVDTPCGQCLLLMDMLLLSGIRSKDANIIRDTKAFMLQNLSLYKCLVQRPNSTLPEQESNERMKELIEFAFTMAEAEMSRQLGNK